MMSVQAMLRTDSMFVVERVHCSRKETAMEGGKTKRLGSCCVKREAGFEDLANGVHGFTGGGENSEDGVAGCAFLHESYGVWQRE